MKMFLKMLLAVIVAHLIVLGVITLIIVGQFQHPPKIESGSVLVQTIAGSIPESTPIGGLPFGGGITHTTLLENLEKARHDKRIAAVVLQFDGPNLGWAKMEELRARIAQVREAGKPVWAHTNMLTASSIFLGSACDRLLLMPNGYVSIRGFAAERPFIHEMLTKLGVKQNLDRIGNYKSAAEILQRDDMSPASRENLEWMIDEFYPAFAQTVETDRKLAPGTLEQSVMASGALLPEQARDLGLVDGLAYWDEIETGLLALPGIKAAKGKKDAFPRPRIISGDDYADIPRDKAGIAADHKIAIVHAMGLITGEESTVGFPLGQTMGAETMNDAFREAAEDPDIAAIIFRVDSGGGESSISWRIQRGMLRAAEKKPVVVSMLDIAASGGYLICYPCQTLVANQLSVVGSIGSISGKFNMRGLYDKLGITKDFVTRGPNALMESDYFDYTPEQWRSFTANHMADYELWVSDIARYRNKTPAEIDSVGRGRVWSGRQALEIGLIDQVGTFDLAVSIAKDKANIPAEEEVEFIHLPQKKNPLEMLSSGGLSAALHALFEEITLRLEREETWAVDWNTYR